MCKHEGTDLHDLSQIDEKHVCIARHRLNHLEVHITSNLGGFQSCVHVSFYKISR